MSDQTKKDVMCKADKVSSELKMKHITGSSKNYEHPADKARRMCSGGYAEGGAVDMPTPKGQDDYTDRDRGFTKPITPDDYKDRDPGFYKSGQSMARSLGTREPGAAIRGFKRGGKA